jgi:sensor c-di-GMP phosphodiesterase-like protein
VAQNFIELEITESAFSENSKSMLENMRILRDKGFKVDIDDFGIGYSSLSFLLDAPIDVVKVDKLFVDNIDVSSRHREYLKQMCILINTTKKNIIFEGVETESQADFLNSCGFDYAQGWLFDKAINITEFEKKYID